MIFFHNFQFNLSSWVSFSATVYRITDCQFDRVLLQPINLINFAFVLPECTPFRKTNKNKPFDIYENAHLEIKEREKNQFRILLLFDIFGKLHEEKEKQWELRKDKSILLHFTVSLNLHSQATVLNNKMSLCVRLLFRSFS